MPLNTLTVTSRPRFLLVAIALIAALLTLSIASSGATAASGGVGAEATPAEPRGSGSRNASSAKYERLWDRVSRGNKRWARSTSKCESGRDPDAIGYGGRYRGAFQFMKATWRASPKSPGGDPIDYSYKTQAVVAVALKRSDGAHHWPVCG